MYRRFVLVCFGLLILLSACSKVSSDSSARPDNIAPASTAATHTKIDRTSPVGASHATPTQSGTVTASSSNGSSTSASSRPRLKSSTASNQKGTLTLALGCSNPNAQDGFSVSGSQARACLYTSPGAQLNIKVSFCGNKVDTSNALQGTFTANASGFYTWNWKPQVSCQTLSTWSTTVSAQLDGSSAVVSEASSAQSSSQSSAQSSSSSSSAVSLPDGQ